MAEELTQGVENKKALLLGVGDRFCGDEGLGCFLVNCLKGRVNIPLINGSNLPEKHLGLLEASHPYLVLVAVATDVPDAVVPIHPEKIPT